MAPTPSNALNITTAGIVNFDGTATFSADTVTQHDVLVGGASNAISSVSPSTAGFVLTSNGVGADPSFQIPAITGALTYFFTNTASDVAAELQQTATTFTPKTTQTFAALGAGDTLLETFITNAGNPGLTFIPAGAYNMHIHASQSGGTRAMTLHAEIWEATSLGVDIARIGTTGVTAVLGGTEVEYTVGFSAAQYTLASTASRIKTKVFATGAGTGSNATVLIYVGDEADSYTQLPGPVADVTNFVPYTGAVKPVNLGPNSITAQSATLTNPLTVPNGGSGVASFNINGPIISNTSTTGALSSITLNNQQFLVGNTSAAPTAKAFSTVTQVFTGNGTYTPTAGMVYCIIEALGGGGAGGGSAVTNGSQYSFGAGGGSGEYARGTFSAATVGVSQAVTIGAAGTANTGATGGNGGNTSVGALISANGGTGGTTVGAGGGGNQAGGAGGTGGAGGSFRTPGHNGGWAYGNTNVNIQSIFGGWGANSQYGSGGNTITTNAAGNAGTGYGAGGSGAQNYFSQGVTRLGGVGTAGLVVVTEYVIA